MKNTPGLVGDHSASVMYFPKDLVCNKGPLNTFSRHMLNTVPPATKTISEKNGERLTATIGPSETLVYHSALEAKSSKYLLS